MKTNCLSTLLAAGALAAGSSVVLPQTQPVPAAQVPSAAAPVQPPASASLTFDQLPPAVQNAIRSQVGDEPIRKISEVNANNQPVYLVTYNRQGEIHTVQVDSSGRVVSATPVAQGRELTSPVRLNFDLLPIAVQNTLHHYSQGAHIQDIEKGTINGQTVYQAIFLHNGKSIDLRVAENGGLVRDAVNDRFLAEMGPQFNAPAFAQPSPGPVPDWHTAPVRKPLPEATPVDFHSLPQAVQSSLATYASGGRLGSIQMGDMGGRTVYEAQIFADGQRTDLRFDRNGALLNDQVNDRFLAHYPSTPGAAIAVGLAPASQSSSGAGYSNLPALSNVKDVSLAQLPAAVRTTLRSEATDASIDRLQQGTVDGKRVYDVSFKRADRWINLRLGDDGSIISSQPLPAR
jgi:hypothetical protein